MDNIISIQEQEFTLISKKVQLEGTCYFNGLTHIAGKIIGDIYIRDKSLLTIEETSSIEGSIHCRDIKIFGKIKGEVISSGKVEVFPSGNFSGLIKSKHLIIHPGSIVNVDGHTSGN